jgi:hypothetical protein
MADEEQLKVIVMVSNSWSRPESFGGPVAVA